MLIASEISNLSGVSAIAVTGADNGALCSNAQVYKLFQRSTISVFILLSVLVFNSCTYRTGKKFIGKWQPVKGGFVHTLLNDDQHIISITCDGDTYEIRGDDKVLFICRYDKKKDCLENNADGIITVFKINKKTRHLTMAPMGSQILSRFIEFEKVKS